MNKPNKMSLDKHRQHLLKSAEEAHAKARATDSDRSAMYYLGAEVAFLIAVADTNLIETNDTSD
jgi:hypothetical protein